MSTGSFPSIRLAPITVYLASCLALVGAQAQLLTPSQVLPLSAPDSDARIAGKEVRLTTGSWLNESGVKRAINNACEAISGCRVVEMASNESTGRVLALILTGPDTDVLTHRLREASMVPSSLSVVDTGVTEELERQRSNQRADIELQAIRSAQLRLSLSISPPLGSSAVGAGLAPAAISIDPISATREHQIQALQRAAGIARVVLDVEPANWWIGTVYERRDSLIFVAIGAAIAVLGTTLLWRSQRQRRSEEGGEQIASHSTLIAMPEWDELTAWPEQPRPTLSHLSQAMTPHFALARPGAVGVACLALQEKPIDFAMDSQNNLGTPFALATPTVGGLDPSPSVTVPSAVAATAPLPADSDKHDRAELFPAQVEASVIASPAAVRPAITVA